MALYRIENTISGLVLGDREAASEQEALDAWARDAGYRDYQELNDEVPAKAGEIRVYCVE